MTRLSLLLLLLLSTGCTASRVTPGPAGAGLAFTHVNVVDVESGRVLPEQTVLIVGNRIHRVGPTQHVRPSRGAQVVEARGRYLIPGLIDTHVHAYRMVDPVADPVFRWFLGNGVTTVRDASGAGREETFVDIRERAEHGEILFPRFSVSGTASRTNIERHGVTDMRALARRLIALGVDGIKIIHISREEALSVLEEAKKADIPVYGHTYVAGGPLTFRPDLGIGYDNYTVDLVQRGLSGVMHIESASPSPARMPPPPTPQPEAENVVEWQLHWVTRWLHASDAETQELIDVMVAQGAWLEPTLIVYDVITNPGRYEGHAGEAVWGMSPAEFFGVAEMQAKDPQRLRAAAVERAKDFVRRFHEAGGRVIVGSDGAPLPGWGTYDDMRLLVDVGLAPLAALQAATIDAARALRWEDRVGSIEEGKLADLVLLDANPLDEISHVRKIRAVVANGRYLDRAALDRLLAGPEAFDDVRYRSGPASSSTNAADSVVRWRRSNRALEPSAPR